MEIKYYNGGKNIETEIKWICGYTYGDRFNSFHDKWKKL